MRVLYLVFMVLALCSCSCGGGNKYTDAESREELRAVHWTLHVDTEFTEDEQRALAEAIQAWSVFTQGRVTISPVTDMDWDHPETVDAAGNKIMWDGTHKGIVRMTSSQPFVKRADEQFQANGRETIFLGCELNGTIFVVVDRIAPGRAMVSVMTHEIGHALGFSHVRQSYSDIMAPSLVLPPPTTFGLHDIAECVKLGFCSRTQEQ